MSERAEQALVSALAGHRLLQPESSFAALCDLSEIVLGHKLFTLMTFDEERGEACRIYSSMPEAYPVSGKKTVHDDMWSNRVIKERQCFVSNSIEGIAEVFPDYKLIQSLGCESVINLPIVVADRFLGTINCLHEANFYTSEQVRKSEQLKLAGTACFLMNLVYFENRSL